MKIEKLKPGFLSLLIIAVVVLLLLFTGKSLHADTLPVNYLNAIYYAIINDFYPPVNEEKLIKETYNKLKISVTDPTHINTHGIPIPSIQLDKTKREQQAFTIGETLVETLKDPYSTLFTPEESLQLLSELKGGKFSGLGIILFPKSNQFIIGGVLRGSPAWRGGIMSGDLLLSIDNDDIRGKSFWTVSRMLAGLSGTSVTLKVGRDRIVRDKISKKIPSGVNKDLLLNNKDLYANKTLMDIAEITLKRVDLSIPLVEVGQHKDIGIIHINLFGEGVASQIAEVLKEFKDKNIKWCLLDLRNNPGGILEEAVRLASLFLPYGSIVCYKDTRVGSITYFSNKDQIWSGYLGILVNGGTASASELVALALKEGRGGIVLGSKTAGKGSVQTFMPLGDGWRFNLTTAHYRSPKGNRVNGIGVKPDYIINEPYLPFWKKMEEKDLVLSRSLDLLKTIPLHGEPAFK